MLKKVIVTNYLGESMEYLIDGVQADNPSGLIITSIDGLGPVKATINMMDLATTDGQLYNSARLSGRNIVIKALFTHASSIEVARLLSYKYFPIKSKVKIRVETDNRIGETEGYVESNEPDIFSEASGCQISIVCESAYFDGGEIKWSLSDTNPLFKFPIGNPSLTEPLIKVSERMNSQLNPIIYEGDTDTGAKFTFGLPTDDVLDSFSVSKIELTKDGKKMSLDMSKMSNLVPNTAPTDLPSSKCSFFLDDTKAKFFKQLPYATDVDLYSLAGFCHTVVYKDELHCIFPSDYSMPASQTSGGEPWPKGDYRHLKLDSETKEWVELPLIKGLTNEIIIWVVNCREKLYTIRNNRYLYYFDDINNRWVNTDIELLTDNGRHTCALAFENKIHYFYETSTNLFHNSWDPNTNTSTEYGAVPIEGYVTSNVYRGPYSHIFQDDNECIYLINNKKMYYWKSSFPDVWPLVSENVPFPYNYITGSIVYKGIVHLFIGASAGIGAGHYVWDSFEGWKRSYDLPVVFFIQNQPLYNGKTNNLAVYNGYIYMIGYGPAFIYDGITREIDPYTEEANNIKLIENDQLVINTIKGKKSITLLRGENKYNVINTMEKDSTWFELQRGTSYFSFSAEGSSEDKLRLTISTNQWYEGV